MHNSFVTLTMAHMSANIEETILLIQHIFSAVHRKEKFSQNISGHKTSTKIEYRKGKLNNFITH